MSSELNRVQAVFGAARLPQFFPQEEYPQWVIWRCPAGNENGEQNLKFCSPFGRSSRIYFAGGLVAAGRGAAERGAAAGAGPAGAATPACAL